MQVFLVGGAVRDGLLGKAIHDKDFVVVGASPDELLACGFTQVGVDFPVFLHPDTHHEYALARTERKTGKSHTEFAVQFDKTIALKDDLQRRDLTINALAIEVTSLFDDTPMTGQVIDYYGGVLDLQQKTLRHVSQAFSEDPLRILRVARFFARFEGFSIDSSTQNLMIQMAKNGDLSHLSKERLWAESSKAMQCKTGFLYWQVLADLTILEHFLPDLAKLWQDLGLKTQTLLALSLIFQDDFFLSLSDDKRLMMQFSLLTSGFNQKSFINTTAKTLCAPKNCLNFSELFFDFKDILQKNCSAGDLINLIERTKAHQEIKDKKSAEKSVAYMLIESIYLYCQACQITPFYTISQIKNIVYQSIICYQNTKIQEIDGQLTGAKIGQALKKIRMAKIQKLLWLIHHDT